MRIHPIPLTILLCFFSKISFSQKDTSYALQLRGGKFFTEKNITIDAVKSFTDRLQKVNGKSFAVLQFGTLPSEAKKRELAGSGIQLLEYIPGNAYTVCITKNIDFAILQSAGARSILELSPEQKMHPAMAKGIFPSWAMKTPGMLDVWISFPKTISFEEIRSLLREKNIEITSSEYSKYHIIGLRIIRQRLIEVAAFPFIEYIEPAPHGAQPLNYIAKQNSRGNVLNSATGIGGFNLKGDGVVVGAGDIADAQYHVDFTGRLINFGSAEYAYHGTHVFGTISGGGIVGEQYAGYAPKSTLISQLLSGIISNASTYVSDYGMVVTNNSYGDVTGDCDYMGYYDLVSRALDLLAFDEPHLQNVFAAGNDGTLTCLNYPSSFRTVLSGYQSAKNVLTVGATDRTGAVTSFSSRGPVKDGRTKPELMADGFFTISTVPTPDDSYGPQPGTSMAAPAVTGGLVLLYEKYRLQNAGANPKNGLMKALVCNGASDLGNTGPDYTYGFGWMNLLRSVDMLSNNRYYTTTINNGGNNPHSISVPANTAQLKITLYWNDPAAAVFSSQALVNDLDLELTIPGPSTVLPYALDTIPANVNNNAIQSADHINNIEQIVINNPVTGTLTANVKGTSVASGPQEYFVVYDIVPNETRLVYPIGNETFVPGETETIQWESYGDPANTFIVEYSVNNGSSWTTINAAVAANIRRLDWIVPAVQTTQALIRVTRNGSGYTSTSSAFTILGMPTLSLASTQCEGYFVFDWTPVAGASDYEVFQLQGTEMVSIGTTSSTTYTISGLLSGTEYWVTVCARLSGQRGRKAFAIKRTPNSGTCTGIISDNDLKMDSIVAPVYGRLNTSTALTTSTIVSARVKNLDDANVTNFKMRYYVGGLLVIEDLVAATITPGNTYTHNFSVPCNFSSAGNYILKVEVENTTGIDPISFNNSITDTTRQLTNDPITLPFTDNIEGASSRFYYKNRFGVEGADRYDFTKTHTQGRLSTFINTGIAYSGTKSLALDLDGWNGATGNTNFVYGTYNLSGVDAAVKDLRLDFQFKSHGDSVVNANNKIWIRGDDSKPWVEAFTLSSNGNVPGLFKRIPSLELSDLLIAASQNFSSSFQVRFGQFGIVRINDNDGFQGHNFDDIRIYEAIDDIQLKTIDEPLSASCNLTSATPVKVTIRNASSNSISNIPVRMVVDGGTAVIETIAGPLGPNASMQYTFTNTADLAALGNHTIEINVQYGTDNFKDNDTLTVKLFHAPLITSFPHVENFEANDGYWTSSGKNNSWEYGEPSANKISKAASGTKAWKTNLTGIHHGLETSYLYSPCYNIAGMTNPTLSLNIALDLEDCGGTLCDGAYIEYSADGISWSRLGDLGTGKNWYNKNYGGNKLWSVENYTRWHVATTALPTGVPIIRFRVVMTSDPFVNREGVAIDDVHVYDNTMGIYDGVTMVSPVTQNISGGVSWINFVSGGKLVASVQPNNQNLGNTDVQTYINTGGVRNNGTQYYHDRNITIKPANTILSDSVAVRFYFLDTETENLLNASGCAACSKPAMATELGVTKYSDPDDNFENGNLADDIQGIFRFLSADWNYKIPFDKGYYVEFKTKDFSEFWLNEGGDDVELISIDEPVNNSCNLATVYPKITVRNASPNSISNVPVRIVVDGGTPVIETIPGPIAPNASIPYTFTNAANLSSFGNHTILINVQYGTDNLKDNDTLRINIYNSPLITTFPHVENFETHDGYWHSDGINSSWEYGTPAASKINKAASRTKAWKTNLTGSYPGPATFYLYSPCYSITGMTNPTLSLHMALDLEDCGGTLCDGAYIEYSADGITWTRLGDVGAGTNWYNRDYGSGNKLWSVQDFTRWHVATTPLPTGIPAIRFRVVVVANPYINFEGVAIDDVHVYDNTMGIYDGVTMGSPVSQIISGGTSWINFISGSKLIASVQPNNQNMGNTEAQAYINTSGVRDDGKQYYHPRNITINPANISLIDSVTVRLYFLDTEIESLLNAAGCPGCTKPSMVTELGVTKYSDPDDNIENGNLSDDIQGTFSFLSADWNLKIPYDKGYYVEFKTKDFSEFWLNNGGTDRQTALRSELISFTVNKKDNKDVIAEWKTAYEKNIDHFEIEVAKGDADFQNGLFVKIGEVMSLGISNSERTYIFTDDEPGKTEIRYYRLKIVNKDNSIAYTPVRSVAFDDEVQWQVYPNPSDGNYEFIYRVDQNEPLGIRIFDASGKLIKQIKLVGSGLQQKIQIDLKSAKSPPGVYILIAEAGEKKYNIKLIKR